MIYPPILRSTQSAFIAAPAPYSIGFSLQRITDPSHIGHVQVRIVLLTNEQRTVANEALYKDGIIYKTWNWREGDEGPYSVTVNPEDLDPSLAWLPDTLYKIQLRFGETGLWNAYPGVSDFAKWKQEQIDNQTFSEWSTVMVVKAITQPRPEIINGEDVKINVTTSDQTEPTLTPLFMGQCPQVDPTEYIDKFQFKIYEEDAEELLEESDWLQHTRDEQDNYRFKHILTNNRTYTVTYEIITANGFKAMASPYTFTAVVAYLPQLQGLEFSAEDDSIYCKENGCINLYLKTDEQFTGTLVITRSSEHSNYGVWEDLRFETYSRKVFDNDLIYQDFTIESGVRYRYAIQQENSAGLRTNPQQSSRYVDEDRFTDRYREDKEGEIQQYKYSKGNTFCVDFDFSYLYHNGVQLRLQFNQKISSFKHTVLRTKQDTLGDKYPHLVQNGNAYYAEFPVSGLISFHMDEDNTFFTLKNDGYYYGDELIIPADKVDGPELHREACEPVKHTQDTTYQTGLGMRINNNLVDNNIFVERKFREKAEEFLNNFDYKLYRSATEGNIVVVLYNVSLTPNSTLGRMVFEFSATAYEVLENTLTNLNDFGIIEIGQFIERLEDNVYSTSFGQIAGVYTTGNAEIDIFSLIRQEEELSLGNGDKLSLDRIESFWIERYPQVSFANEIAELETLKNEVEDEEELRQLEELIAEYTNLQSALELPPAAAIVKIEDNQVVVAPNRIYSAKVPIKKLKLVSSNYPIIINYICRMKQETDTEVGVPEAIDSSRVWGQISGIFTGTDKILKYYKYDYHPGEPPMRIYSDIPVRYDSLGGVVIDSTNFNVYKTTNLYSIIEEETRHQVELMYNVTGGFQKDINGKWTNSSGTIGYEFSDIVTFDIEADPKTVLYVSQNANGSNPTTIVIGDTGRYVLKPMEQMIKYIALAEGQYALINYKSVTTQTKWKKG